MTLSLVLTSPCRPLELAAVWKGNAAEGEGESVGQAPWGPMTGRQKDLYWVLSLFLMLRMVETVSGARGPFTGTHMSSPFSASDVKQTPTVDVYIQVGSWHQAGVYSPNQRIFVASLLCGRYPAEPWDIPGNDKDKTPCPHGANSLLGGQIKE